MTDEEILWKCIDLKDSALDEDGKAELMDIIIEQKKGLQFER